MARFLSDTTPDAAAVQFAMLQRMSEVERLELMQALTLAAQELAFAGMRERHPSASDDEIWLRLAVARLGEETVRKVYGFVPGDR